MKVKTLLLIITVAMYATSCSKCYECTHEVEIESGGTTTISTSEPKEYCTANGEEIEELEADGNTCK
jgi:hypothetical protein